MLGTQPVLIDFGASIFDRDDFLDRPESRPPGGAPIASGNRQRVRRFIKRLLRGEDASAKRVSARFLAEVKSKNPQPKILVIGGGTLGSGAEEIYRDSKVLLIGTDVFASSLTVMLTDGHQLPFADESIDGVWIQAVLEHVLDPRVVVGQIHRVLKPEGIVFAGTPFMQQVHMGAFDFTRFTLGGHRWLFRRFEQIEAGISGGAGISTIWSIRYLVRALGAGPTLASACAGLFFWLRFLDRFASPNESADAASGVYFLGRKSAVSLEPKEMRAYYRTGGGIK